MATAPVPPPQGRFLPVRQGIILGGVIILLLVMMFWRPGTQPERAPKTTTADAKAMSAESAAKFKKALDDAFEKEKQKQTELEQKEAAIPQQQGQSVQAYQPIKGKRMASSVVWSADKQQERAAIPQQLSDLRNQIEDTKGLLAQTLKPAPQTPVPVPAQPLRQSAQDRTEGRERAERPEGPEEAKRKPIDPELQKHEGKEYRMFEGDIIETVLENRLNGSFTGPVIVQASTPVWSHDHQHVLIPQGSRIIGEAQRVSSTGQQRLAVFFHRIVMPDGFSVSLDQFKGLNQIGETGLRDQVNHHYASIFGSAIALGLIGGFSQSGANYGYNEGGLDAYRRGIGTSLSQSGTTVLDRSLNILPTFTIREGHRIKVILSQDLMLPALENHRIEPDV